MSAQTVISALNQLSGDPTVDDLIAIVDASAGETKNAKIANLFALLTGATFTGDVKVGDGTNSSIREVTPQRELGGLIHGAALGVTNNEGALLRYMVDGAEEGRLQLRADDISVSFGGSGSTDPIADYGGSAANGYIRFYNGVQICWLRRYFDSVDINTGVSGTGYVSAQQSWTYAASFSGTPIVIPDTQRGSVLWFSMIKLDGSPGQSSCNYRFLANSQTGVRIYAHMHAIGRWK